MGHLRAGLFVAAMVLSFLAWSAPALADEPEPLSVTVSSTRETCTLGSVTTLEYAIDGGVPSYQVTVDGNAVEQSSELHYIRCRSSAIWSPLETLGDGSIQRINVSVRDSAGAHAYAIAELHLVTPLPAPPWIEVTSELINLTKSRLTAEWRVPFRYPAPRPSYAAIRWRVPGSSSWNVEPHSGEQQHSFSYEFSWRIDSPPSGGQREVQVAELRHELDLHAPEALAWSPTALVAFAVPPRDLQAEATHDSITLRWGPHGDGLAFVARLVAVDDDRWQTRQEHDLDSGPLFRVRFDDLLPDTLYRVEVALKQSDRRSYPLEQHLFEMRTEPSPAGWSAPSRSPTDVAARSVEDGLEVTWIPPSTGLRYDTSVCAQLVTYPDQQRCETVPPGQARALLPLAQPGQGGTFQISVETLTAPAGVGRAKKHVPTYDSELPTRGVAPPAPQFSELSWFLHADLPRSGFWHFHSIIHEVELAEISWRENGHRIVREVSSGEFTIAQFEGDLPQGVRIRLLRNGVWTPWSASADVPQMFGKVSNVRYNERPDGLEIRWDAPPHGDETLGYQLIWPGDEDVVVIDVGRQTHTLLRFRLGYPDFWYSIQALAEGYGPVGSNLFRPYERSPLTLRLTAEYSPCPPAAEARMALSWSITGGAAPFIVMIGDLAGFETDERHGSIVVECQLEPDGALQEISASVIDAYGRTDVETFGADNVRTPIPEPGDDPFAIQFGLRSVHRDRLLLSWDCRYWPSVWTDNWPVAAMLRWRVAGEDVWRYRTDIRHTRPSGASHETHCRASWDGLEPSTTYEYQLARFDRLVHLSDPEQLQWSKTETVTTLGEPQQLSVERNEETVTVRWQRQPEAWAYVVVLRAEGRSWWKRYDPSGEPTEEVIFHDVPSDLSLRLELVSPPLEHGKEMILPGYEPNIAYGE